VSWKTLEGSGPWIALVIFVHLKQRKSDERGFKMEQDEAKSNRRTFPWLTSVHQEMQP
jgi:hypothetical protein